MIYLLFIFYCFLFCWLICRISFFTQSGLSTKILLSLFVLRIISLVISSYMNLYYFPISDSVIFHKMGIAEYHLLFQNPKEYIANIFYNNYPDGYSRLLDDSHSYWNNLRTNLLVKMLSIFDLFSFKIFFINTLFYNFLVFFGCVALYKIFIRIFPGCFYQLIICIFLLPSVLFFSSMIHRDGLILLSVSMIIYHVFFIINNHQLSWKRISIIIFFLCLIFLLRNFVFFTLVPALAAWLIAQKYPRYVFISFLSVYTFVAILFFTSGYISPRADLPQYVVSRQTSFTEIGKGGTSTIPINPLSPTFKSFITNAPQSFDHALLRPYLTKILNFEYLPFTLEIFIIEILFIVFLFCRKKNIIVDPLIYFGLFFSLTMFLITGYTVPIIGAIVRYRSIYLIFLLIPIMCYTDWSRIKKLITSKKN